MKRTFNSPIVKIIFGLLIGAGLLLLISRFVNVAKSLAVVQQHLMTPRGVLFTLIAGVFFLLAFALRGVRWKLILNSAGQIKTITAIRIVLISIFLNFLLVTGSGEIARSLILKRTAQIPISRSLPTIAMDRSLDLLPALFIIVAIPFLGLQMDIKLWIVLSLVASLLIGLICFIGLTAWKRSFAIKLLHKIITLIPFRLGHKIEDFATNFVDSLINAARRPKIFLPAILLTCLAVFCDGLFAMFIFWAIGLPVSFRLAIFGYTFFNMSTILPSPPGQLGSNEAIGLLVFSGLLHLPADKVTAMFVVSHPWAAILMFTACIFSLKSLGLTISSTFKMRPSSDNMPESKYKANSAETSTEKEGLKTIPV
ncbi:MAG TPA: lysylphosphatidylglycerol synthase transmembrane domain-containing protein [Ktedonobacteraceae bacterium]